METAVYSIAEAVEQLVRQRPPSTIPHPVDVLGIVTGEVVVTTGHHRCTTIEIVDETSSALVTLRHHHDARPLPRLGDLCRFNRVGLPRDRRRYSTPCLPHFRYYPWDDVEDGLDWFCLGRVRDGRLVVSKSAMTMIPNPMRTDAGQIQRLVQWYSHSPIATTYAGGARSMEDLQLVSEKGQGRIGLTIGSALDIFGGDGVRYEDAVAFNRRASAI